MEQKNQSIQTHVNYSGIIKNIPSSGSNQLSLDCDGSNYDLKINTCELSNGTSSLFISNLTKTFNSYSIPVDTVPTRTLGFNTESTGFYIWLAANPYSLLEQNIDGFDASTTQSGIMTKSNLKLKLFLSKSDSWAGINSTYKSSDLKGFDWRCRIGWLKKAYNPAASTNNIVTPFNISDNKITLHNNPLLIPYTQSGNAIINYDLYNYVTVSTSTVSAYIPDFKLYAPTVMSNTTNSTASMIEGVCYSYTTQSFNLIPSTSFNVLSENLAINLFNQQADIRGVVAASTDINSNYLVSGNFTIPVFTTDSSIVYQYRTNITSSTGIIQFNTFYLDQGAF